MHDATALYRSKLTNTQEEFTMRVQAYITFAGRCQEALAFYKNPSGPKSPAGCAGKKAPMRT